MKKILTILLIMMGGIIGGNFVYADEQVDDFSLPEIYFKAVNPGYTIDGKNNVGEMIEIGRKNSDEMISLAGITVSYTNSSGNETVLVEFPENSFIAGEPFLLRLASSPESELAALNYAKTLAFKAGPLVLKRGDEILDVVCWTGKDGCTSEFKSANPTVLVRNLETGEFVHTPIDNYEVVYNPESYYVKDEPVDEEGKGSSASQCKGLVFSEVLSYYDTSQREQFVEFYNSGVEHILLDGCQLRYKNKYYPLSGIVKPEGYFVRYLEDFSITKNPTNFNVLELIDTDGNVIDRMEYPNGQRKGASYILVGYDPNGEEIWRVTFMPTPGESNNYQEYKTCEDGKVINEATGNCVKVTTVSEKVCAEGQYLNPLTGRCKKIEAIKETTCKEGYELNPETGRCKKVKENTGANYSITEETYKEESSFIALYLVLGVVGVGLIYVIYEFRHEILKLIRKVLKRFH